MGEGIENGLDRSPDFTWGSRTRKGWVQVSVRAVWVGVAVGDEVGGSHNWAPLDCSSPDGKREPRSHDAWGFNQGTSAVSHCSWGDDTPL